MTLPSSGVITLQQIATEAGVGLPFSLDTYTARRMCDVLSGPLNMQNFYGKMKTIELVSSGNTLSLNLFVAAGSPTTPVRVLHTINGGVVIGSNNPSQAALIVGQFPAGSIIYVYNYGTIQGCQGAAGTWYVSGGIGGRGGDAIMANYPSQTISIFNNPGASIYAGGGGGGCGGGGGAGGQGGTGYNGPGGAGGAGAIGGDGGHGTGYGGSYVAGVAGPAGGAGVSYGDFDRGIGGNGGSGGFGGGGGDWGQYGNQGAPGGTGGTGTGGSIGAGQPGSAGGAGGAGGAPGLALNYGGQPLVSLSNSGALIGNYG